MNPRSIVSVLISLYLSVGTGAFGQSPVSLTVDASSRGYTVPADFSGVSIFTRTQVEGHRGVPGNLFSGTNTQLITFFKNAGLHHVRLGATGASPGGGQKLSQAGIDAPVAFTD